jgi:hypothetical protein
LPGDIFSIVKNVVLTGVSYILDGLANLASNLPMVGEGLSSAISSVSNAIRGYTTPIEDVLSGMGGIIGSAVNAWENGVTAFNKTYDKLSGIGADDHAQMLNTKEIAKNTKKTIDDLRGFVDIARDSMMKFGEESGSGIVSLDNLYGGNSSDQSDGGVFGKESMLSRDGLMPVNGSQMPTFSGSQQGGGNSNVTNNLKIDLKVDALTETQLNRLGDIVLDTLTRAMKQSVGTSRDF